jgi:hypothetical protein
MNDTALLEFDFDGLSEADIREEIIAPLLRKLGYRSGTENNILREKQVELRYPKMYLGRKKPKQDLVLRGIPDYICEARGITRWAIEAKAPSQPIGRDDIEQAHSYSMHPELAAPLFVLCNGHEFLVFRTNHGPAAAPILALTYTDIQNKFYILENLLSPKALNQHYPVRVVDLGEPLADGHGSTAKVVGGITRHLEIRTLWEGVPEEFDQSEAKNVEKLVGFQAAITGNRIYRDNDRGIVADIEMSIAHENLKKLVDTLGLAERIYVTRDWRVSQDPLNPTIFEYSFKSYIPAGTSIYDITSWSENIAPVDSEIYWYEEAIGFLKDDRFSGVYTARALLTFPSFDSNIRYWTLVRGSYEIELQT